MSLSDLASLGSFVSGVAVVFSFIFLGIQIRQSDRNQKAILSAQSSSQFSEHMLKLIEPQFADLYRRMMEGETEFTATESLQLMGFVSAILSDLEDIDTRDRMGLADGAAVQSLKQGASNLLSFPFARALWRFGESTFSPSFRSQINTIIREMSVQPPPDVFLVLKASAVQEKKQMSS